MTPKTGARCGCRPGVQRDNCPACEGSGMVIDFAAIREAVSRGRDRLRYGSKGDWCRYCLQDPVKAGAGTCLDYRGAEGARSHEAMDRAVLRRCRVEERITRATLRVLLDAPEGYTLSVFDGEAETPKTRDFAVLAGAMHLTDEDYINVWTRAKEPKGWVRFVYGNDGYDVICDYTTNLEEVLAPVLALAEGIERGDG